MAPLLLRRDERKTLRLSLRCLIHIICCLLGVGRFIFQCGSSCCYYPPCHIHPPSYSGRNEQASTLAFVLVPLVLEKIAVARHCKSFLDRFVVLALFTRGDQAFLDVVRFDARVNLLNIQSWYNQRRRPQTFIIFSSFSKPKRLRCGDSVFLTSENTRSQPA
jgi:hypothetical protein